MDTWDFANGGSLDSESSFILEADGVTNGIPAPGDIVKMGDYDAVNAPYCDSSTPNGGTLDPATHSVLSYGIAGQSNCHVGGTLGSVDIGGVRQFSGNGGTLQLDVVNGPVTNYNVLMGNTVVLLGGPFNGGIADLGVYGTNQFPVASEVLAAAGTMANGVAGTAQTGINGTPILGYPG